MQPANLIPGKQYNLTVPGQPPRVVIYRYETLNYWLFDNLDLKPTYLHKQQVINHISDI